MSRYVSTQACAARRRLPAPLVAGAALLLALLLEGCTTGRKEAAPAGTDRSLRVALISEPTTLDPAKIQDLVTLELLCNCFEGLVRYNAQNQIEPCLAERWEISPDRRSYTFFLRDGVVFHNGRPLTAADIKYSWERALTPDTHSNVAANYLGAVEGASEVTAGRRKDLPGVEVAGPRTLRVRLDRPRAYALGLFAYPTGFVVCKEAVEQTGGEIRAQSLVGTGPFTLQSYQPGVRIVLKANPRYWGGRPRMDRVEGVILLNRDTAYDNFRTLRIDLFLDVPMTRYAQDRHAGNLKSDYHLFPTASVDYLVMHPGRQPVFARKEVRQAFSLAIDRNEILRLAYKSVGVVADRILPPSLPGTGNSPPPRAYDPMQARSLLARAGYPEGKEFPALTLTTLEHDPARTSACQMIAQQLKKNLGVRVTLQEREAAQYWEDAAAEKMEFYLTGWTADYPDAQDFLSTLFASRAALNHTGYRNARFDSLCARADADSDPKRRAALYAEADALLMADAGVLPLVFPQRPGLIRADVTGWQINLCSLLPLAQTEKRVP